MYSKYKIVTGGEKLLSRIFGTLLLVAGTIVILLPFLIS